MKGESLHILTMYYVLIIQNTIRLHYINILSNIIKHLIYYIVLSHEFRHERRKSNIIMKLTTLHDKHFTQQACQILVPLVVKYK